MLLSSCKVFRSLAEPKRHGCYTDSTYEWRTKQQLQQNNQKLLILCLFGCSFDNKTMSIKMKHGKDVVSCKVMHYEFDIG